MLIVLTVFLHIFALYVFKIDLISCDLPFISFFVCGKSQSRARSLKYLFKRLDVFYAKVCWSENVCYGKSKEPHVNLSQSLWMSEIMCMSHCLPSHEYPARFTILLWCG